MSTNVAVPQRHPRREGTSVSVESPLAVSVMPEAEVALHLTFHLIGLPHCGSDVVVNLDGAHVVVHGREVLPVARFLDERGWRQLATSGKNPWQWTYIDREGRTLHISAKSGEGDVVCRVGPVRVRAECKKGPLNGAKGNPEYPLLREALGQLLTVKHVETDDRLVVAVPDSPKFRQLALQWREAPLVRVSCLRIVLVGRDGVIDGLDGLTAVSGTGPAPEGRHEPIREGT